MNIGPGSVSREGGNQRSPNQTVNSLPAPANQVTAQFTKFHFSWFTSYGLLSAYGVLHFKNQRSSQVFAHLWTFAFTSLCAS